MTISMLIPDMLSFLNMPNKERAEMGERGRLKMEREFDRKIVIRAYLKMIAYLTSGMR